MSNGIGFGHLGGQIALAAWAGLQIMPAAPSSLLIEYRYSTLEACSLLPSRNIRMLQESSLLANTGATYTQNDANFLTNNRLILLPAISRFTVDFVYKLL